MYAKQLFAVWMFLFQTKLYDSFHTRLQRIPRVELSSSISDTFKYPLPDLATVKAVEKQREKRLSEQRNAETISLSPSDLCQITGNIDLSTAQRELSALGYIVGSNLTVSEEGDIVYSFPCSRSITSLVYERNLALNVKLVVEDKVLPFAYSSVKVLFGVFLLSSLAIAATAAMAALVASSSSSSSDDKDNRRSSSGVRLSRVMSDITFDLYRFQSYGDEKKKNPNDIGFISSFYSFVFGDGNPNADLSQDQLKTAISIIRENNGIVCAEQLAPYLNPPTVASSINSFNVDESWMLETILKLNGVPVVTDEGDIVYDFSDIVESKFASSSSPASDNGTKPLYIEESTIPFSRACKSIVSMPAALGVLNIVGVATIRSIVKRGILASAFPAFNAFLIPTYPLLLAYSVFYIVTPVVRMQFLNKANEEIAGRNQKRKEWHELLKSKGSYIPRKLNAIKKIVDKAERLKKDDAGEGRDG
jgi:hypothetical protein